MGEAALAERVRPLNVVDLEKMDKVQLEDRAKEYWKVIQSINGEKNELSKRMEEQDREIKDAVQRLAEVMAAKQARKHPPKKQMTSKFDNRKGNRTYEERKDMYDQGVANVRPKMLVNVWQAKFSAWMEDDQALSFLDGVKKE